MATIKLDVELEQPIDQLAPKPADVEKLTELYTTFELRRMLADLKAGNKVADASSEAEIDESPSADIDTQYDIIFDEAELDAWLAKLENAEGVAFDTETTSLDYMVAELVGVSFSVEVGKAA